MTLLLHVSDPHFGTEITEVCDALAAFAHKQRPDMLLVTGDITQRATAAQFAAARAFVQRLGIERVAMIAGNHDIPLFNVLQRAFSPYGRFRKEFGRELEPVVETDDALVIAVKTTRRWRHSNGEVSGMQIERVARRLARATARQLRLVLVHQPVAVSRPEDDHNLLRGHDAAIRRWSEAGADLVVGGHIHLPYVLPLTGPERAMWAVQAGTAVSRRIRSNIGNSVNLIRTVDDASRRRCEVERWDFSGGTKRFEVVECRVLDLQAQNSMVLRAA